MQREFEGLKNPRDVKLNVKIVFYSLVHSGIWEGPCRYDGGGVGPEKERQRNRQSFEGELKRLKEIFSKEDVNILEPVYLEFPEFVSITQKDLVKLEADKGDVDLYVVIGTNLNQYLGCRIGEIYKKPVLSGSEVSAYLRSKGLEGYAGTDCGGPNKLISLLRVRKTFQQTNMLLITDFGIPGYPAASSVWDFKMLKDRFGIDVTVVGFKELSDERDRILSKKDSMAEVKGLTDRLIKNAQKVHMGKEEVLGDVLFYYSIKSLMKKYHCNGFSIECFEFCGARLPDKWKVTPCLPHSLLRDEGYPSSCEGDISALLTLNIFMALSKSSSYMGNILVTRKNDKRSWESEKWEKGVNTGGDKLAVQHNVPGLKMLGFDKPDLPYELRNHINAKPSIPGWGTSFKIDFTKIKEKTVTIARLDPLVSKMLVTKGEVVGVRGFDSTGCSSAAIINAVDPKGFYIKTSDYGHHFTMTYGDHTQDLVHLAKILNIKIELHG